MSFFKEKYNTYTAKRKNKRAALIKKLYKRRDVLTTLHNQYRDNECVQLLGIDTSMGINPNTYCNITESTSNAEIIKKTKTMSAFARLLKAYVGLAEMNGNNPTHPCDPLLSSFAAELFIASGPLVHSMLNRFPFRYTQKQLYTLNNMTALTNVLIDAERFCHQPDRLAFSQQLENSLVQFNRSMNKTLLLNYITPNKLKTFFAPICYLFPTGVISGSLYAVVMLALMTSMAPILAILITIIAGCLAAAIITIAVVTILDIKTCLAEKQSIKAQASIIHEVKNHFNGLTKEHGLFKVKKQFEVGQVGMVTVPQP